EARAVGIEQKEDLGVLIAVVGEEFLDLAAQIGNAAARIVGEKLPRDIAQLDIDFPVDHADRADVKNHDRGDDSADHQRAVPDRKTKRDAAAQPNHRPTWYSPCREWCGAAAGRNPCRSSGADG